MNNSKIRKILVDVEVEAMRYGVDARFVRDALDDLANLEKFVNKMFELSDWPEGGDIDMFEFQEAAIECGLLIPETRFAPCADDGTCNCREYYGDDEFEKGIICYRREAKQ